MMTSLGWEIDQSDRSKLITLPLNSQ